MSYLTWIQHCFTSSFEFNEFFYLILPHIKMYRSCASSRLDVFMMGLAVIQAQGLVMVLAGFASKTQQGKNIQLNILFIPLNSALMKTIYN